MSIDRLLRQSAASSSVISLGGGLPSAALFPRKQFAKAFLFAMSEPRCCALQYDWPEGQNSLREWVAQRLRHRGAEVGKEDVLITAGAQQALALAASFLVQPGTAVDVERETYPAALELFRRRGAKLVSGDEAAGCIYFVDGISNPRGRIPDARFRARLLQGDTPIIADEAYAELSFGGALVRPLVADGRSHVWHVGTLSKTLSPGLRLGWLLPPRPMLQQAIELKQTIDLQSASLSQVIAERFLEQDDFEARLARQRTFYQQRAETLARALRRFLLDWRFSEPEGGFSIFAETDYAGSDEDWLRVAVSHGVSFDPGSLFRSQPNGTSLGMRLSYSATAPNALIEAAQRLGKAWKAYRGQA